MINANEIADFLEYLAQAVRNYNPDPKTNIESQEEPSDVPLPLETLFEPETESRQKRTRDRSLVSVATIAKKLNLRTSTLVVRYLKEHNIPHVIKWNHRYVAKVYVPGIIAGISKAL